MMQLTHVEPAAPHDALEVRVRRGCSRGVRAFTLTELLVVIGVVGLLIAVVAAALSGGRAVSMQTVSLSNLRGIGVTFALYTSAHDEAYPFVQAGEEVLLSTPGEGEPFRCGFSPHWFLEGLWPVLFHEIAPWPQNFQQWLSPGVRREPPWRLGCGLSGSGDDGGWVSYRYSNSFIGQPRIWGGTAGVSDADISPVRMSQVRAPANKVLMYDSDRTYLDAKTRADAPTPLLFADASAAARRIEESLAPVVNPLYWLSPRPFHDTRDGVEGRDFR